MALSPFSLTGRMTFTITFAYEVGFVLHILRMRARRIGRFVCVERYATRMEPMEWVCNVNKLDVSAASECSSSSKVARDFVDKVAAFLMAWNVTTPQPWKGPLGKGQVRGCLDVCS